MPYPQSLSAWLVQMLLHPTPTISSVALSPKYLCIDICMNAICVLCCYVAIVQCYVVDICMSVCLSGVVAYTLWLCGKRYCG